MKKLQKFNDYELLNHFEDAVRESHYHPYGEPYNKSGYSYDQLRNELKRRLNTQIESEEDDSIIIYADMITTKTYTRDDMIHALTYGHGEGKKGISHSETLKEYRKTHL